MGASQVAAAKGKQPLAGLPCTISRTDHRGVINYTGLPLCGPGSLLRIDESIYTLYRVYAPVYPAPALLLWGYFKGAKLAGTPESEYRINDTRGVSNLY